MKVIRVYTELSETYRFGGQFRKKLSGPSVIHKGHPLKVSAADIHFLGQLGLPADCKITQSFFADIAAAREGDEIAQARVKSFLNQVQFSKNEIITLKKGKYRRLGGGFKDNPRHSVKLERDYYILPLNLEFLQLFSGNSITERLLRLAVGSGESTSADSLKRTLTSPGEDVVAYFRRMHREWLVVNFPSVSESVNLAEIMNPALISALRVKTKQGLVSIGVRLRPLSEPLAEVFMSAHRKINESFSGRHIITASRYDKQGVDARALEIELARENITDSDKFVFRNASYPSRRFTKSPFATDRENCIIYELVPLQESLFKSPIQESTSTLV